jgi:hypothetical protein
MNIEPFCQSGQAGIVDYSSIEFLYYYDLWLKAGGLKHKAFCIQLLAFISYNVHLASYIIFTLNYTETLSKRH